jgi:VIT1/CCC1 family predicted Fe2+/Mn2+ transporter
MYELLQKLHSWWAYLALIILFLTVINAVIGYSGKKLFQPKDLRISLFGLIFAHIQLLLGLMLYIIHPWEWIL